MFLPLKHTEPLSIGLRAGGKWLNWSKSTPAKPVWETPFVAADHLQPCKADADLPTLQEAAIDDRMIYTADSMVTFSAGQPIDVVPIPPGMHGTDGPHFPLGDPGFETVQVGAAQFQYRPTGSPWTFTGGAGISANKSPFTVGATAAPEGMQIAFLQGASSISQAIAGWTIGMYLLTFSATQRIGSQHAQQDIAVLIDDVTVGTVIPSVGSYQRYVTGAFAITAGSHTVTFKGLNTAGGDNTAFVDWIVPYLVG